MPQQFGKLLVNGTQIYVKIKDITRPCLVYQGVRGGAYYQKKGEMIAVSKEYLQKHKYKKDKNGDFVKA